MAYANTTWGALKDSLRERLSYPLTSQRPVIGHDFWTDDLANKPEISGLLRETLYYWGIVSYGFRERITLELQQNVQVYDLRTHASNFFASTLTRNDLLAEIEHHLLEPVSLLNLTWAGSLQFEWNEIVEGLQRRRDQFLAESGIWVDYELLTTGLPVVGSPRWNMPDDVIDVRRLALLDLATPAVYTHLWRSDKLKVQYHNPAITTGPPQVYTQSDVPVNQIELIPPADQIYKVDLYSVRSGASFQGDDDVALGMPDEFAWGVKWGTLADLLGKDGPARDAERAEYAELRFRQAVELARAYPSIETATLAAKTTMPITSLHGLDAHKPGWQNTAAGPPEAIANVGRNLIVVHPKPDLDDAYSIELDVIRPAPIPDQTGDFIQAHEGAMDALLDYGQHIATFKEAGTEFSETIRHADNLLKMAGVDQERLRAQGLFIEEMLDRGTRDEKMRLRRAKPTPQEVTEVIHA